MARIRHSYLAGVCIITQLLLAALRGRGDTVIQGDVYIEGFFSTYHPNNGQCGATVDHVSVQSQEAVKWVLDQLNTKRFGPSGDTTYMYIPGNKIGLRVHDTCRSPDTAKEIAFNITRQVDGANRDTVAILGPEYSSEAQQTSRLISGLPSQAQLLQVGYSTTASSLSDHTLYANFYRTIPPDTIQTQMMRKFMTYLKWTYVAIIHDRDAYGNEAVEQLLHQSETPITCFPVIIPVDTSLVEAEVKSFLEAQLLSMHTRETAIEGIIIFGSRSLGNNVLDTIYKLNRDNEYKIPVILGSEAIDYIEGTHSHLCNITKGMFISSPPRKYIDEFNDHWRSIMTDVTHVKNNSLLSALQESVTGCNPSVTDNCSALTPGEVDANFPPSHIVQYAVQAVLVIAKAVNIVHSNVCTDSQGQCARLIEEPKASFITALENEVVSFDDDFNPWRVSLYKGSDLRIQFPSGSGDAVVLKPDISTYDVYNRRSCGDGSGNAASFCWKEVLEYFEQSDNYKLNLGAIRDYDHTTHTETTDIRRPQCPSGQDCDECPSARIPGVEVVEGDMYVVGICPIHSSSGTPLTCGTVKRGGLDVAEAIKFEVKAAMDEIKNKIPDANIGTIIIDSCWDPQIIAERVINIHKQGVLINGSYVDVKYKILGYIGSWMSDISIEVAEILTRLGYVQISYASTSPLLSNRDIYPYFMRVVYSDIEQAKEMLNTVQKTGSNNVQILYSESAYGIGAKDALEKYAPTLNICVSNSIGVPVTEHNFDNIKAELTKEGRPNVIMLFLSSLKLEEMLPMLNTLKGYVMIASEAWGTRDILTDVTNLNNSITFANELPINNIFEKHFQSLSPTTSSSPWLDEYMQFYFHCYFEWSFRKSSNSGKQQCTHTTTFGDGSYKIETWVPFAVTALKALLMGARITLDDVCNGSSSICPEYYSHQQTLVDNIRVQKVDYNRLFSPMDVFDEHSDGRIPYNKYQIVIKNGVATYTKLGTSWSWHGPRSVCSADDEVCRRCFPGPTTAAPEDEEESRLGLQVSLAVFVVLTVALAATIAFAVWAYRRRRCCFKYVERESVYITPSADKDLGYGSDGLDQHAPPNMYIPAEVFDDIHNV